MASICLISLSILAPLVAVMWWWVTWPERTSHEFITLVAKGEFDAANELMEHSTRWVLKSDGEVALDDDPGDRPAWHAAVWQGWFEEPFVWHHSPDLLDLVSGRRTFSTCLGHAEFTVERGKVRYQYKEFLAIYGPEFYRPDNPHLPKALRDLAFP